MAEALNRLREQVRRVDAELLSLIARRMALVRDISVEKRAAGEPLRDWDMERQVLARAAQTATALGLAPALARNIFQSLIAESRIEQERHSYRGAGGSPERIVIIGGRGRMGRWLDGFLSNQGHTVTLFDRRDLRAGDDPQPALAEALRGTTLALLATPLEQTVDAIAALSALAYTGVAGDIASLKGHLSGAIAQARAGGMRYASLHPMFGPSARTLSDKVVCICDCGDSEASGRLEALFSGTAATLVRLSLEEHDRIAANVLGLSHLVNLLFAQTLRDSGLPYAQIERIGSTTFHSQMATTHSVVDEDAALYYAIQRLNPFGPELYARVERALKHLTGAVLSGDRDAFVALMDGCRAWIQNRDAS